MSVRSLLQDHIDCPAPHLAQTSKNTLENQKTSEKAKPAGGAGLAAVLRPERQGWQVVAAIADLARR